MCRYVPYALVQMKMQICVHGICTYSKGPCSVTGLPIFLVRSVIPIRIMHTKDIELKEYVKP